MELKDVLGICFSQGKTWYNHPELEELILKRFGFNFDKHINAIVIRSLGIKDTTRKVNGRSVKGFWLDIKNYTEHEINMIYASRVHEELPIVEPGITEEEECIDKKIRFLIRDWAKLPVDIQMEFKKYKEQYLNEVLSGEPHDRKWFYKITTAVGGIEAPAEDEDFVIKPVKKIMQSLYGFGKIRDYDKAGDTLLEHGYVRINDFVYGILKIGKINKHLPD